MQYKQQRCSSSSGAYNSACTIGPQTGQRRNVAARDDNWRIEMKCAVSGSTTTTRCCSCFLSARVHRVQVHLLTYLLTHSKLQG